ncbi:MAG TPA: tRNA lysidine(34) synthetase TilS [Bacteroidales bacterium]|nr:tRNA lysidine(34) synthetase TilS [Bacteroidales bacterium]
MTVMLQQFLQYLDSICKGHNSGRFLLTVSGGIDSAVMSHLFHSAGLPFAIAHCNFALRGAESDGDEKFVRELAVQYNVPFYSRRFQTSEYATDKGISIQMAARDLRYEWFTTLSGEYNYDYIATGHNKNDVVETMLLNLSRGTGLRGLMGIKPVNGLIIRPLLFATRADIEKYAGEHNLRWRDDSSNEQTKYHRNKIRHLIIPAFESINPAFLQNALDTIDRVQQTGVILDHFIAQAKEKLWNEKDDRILIDIEGLKQLPAYELILFEFLKPFGITHLNQDALIRTLDCSASGKQFHTGSHILTRDRDYLIVTKNKNHQNAEVMIHENTSEIRFPLSIKLTRIKKTDDFTIPVSPKTAALDADLIRFPILVRKWTHGDRFYPLGSNGSKKLSDFLINIKLPLPDKDNVWVIESEGKIAWIVNLRIDDRFKITEQTQNILIIELQ